MRSLRLRFRILGAALIILLPVGCSNSSAPAPSYSLNLTLVSYMKNPNNSGIDTLNFQVTKAGKNLTGASLTSLTDPYGIATTYAFKSDSLGIFPPLTIVLNDSFVRIAYRAVYDTFTSNYVFWQWQ